MPFPDPTSFRRLIGKLIYLTNMQPDIAYVVTNHHSPSSCYLDFVSSQTKFKYDGIFLSINSEFKLNVLVIQIELGVPKLENLYLDT